MNSLTKNRLKLVFIATLFALPVMTAWTVFKNPQWLEGGDTKNYGELISPAIPSTLSDFIIDGDTINLDHLKGRWVLLHLDVDGQCDESCEKSVHMLRQLHTLLNKDTARLVRVYLNSSNDVVSGVLSDDPKLSVYVWDNERLLALKKLVGDITDGDMLMLDPLGNIMMRYHQDADPYGIKKDWKLLFKASQIG
ncbi:MAG: hypothetical protein COB26_08360 [Piscirickettsiaceae bacterium]|nr:MAG: hypothetical protein COB26_08360 [Piscirickettsiaceae bacterium]